jgi:hypothetical protein
MCPLWPLAVGAFLPQEHLVVRKLISPGSRDEFLSLTVKDIRPPEETPAFQDPLCGKEEDPDKNWIHVKKDGTQIYVKVRGNDARFHGRQGRFVIAEDVTERRHLQTQLLQMAHHDGLTGLPNRILLSNG